MLYAERTQSRDLTCDDVLRQLRRTAAANSRHGPVWLGYRLGHLQGDSRIFRALVYNKGALVLHMLRRLVGDEAFFRGLRRFYRDSRFQKVGTGDVQRAFEAESGQLARTLLRALDSGVRDADAAGRLSGGEPRRGARLPLGTRRLRRRDRADGAPAGGPAGTGDPRAAADGGRRAARADRRAVFDMPVTVTLVYASGPPEDVLVRVTDKVVETRLPLRGALRSVEVNRDDAALVEIVRNGAAAEAGSRGPRRCRDGFSRTVAALVGPGLQLGRRGLLDVDRGDPRGAAARRFEDQRKAGPEKS